MTRFWVAGKPIQVLVHHDLPVFVVLNGKKQRVIRIVRRWRIDEGWWEARIWRDYFKLHTHLYLMIIYRDLLAEHWYLQRLYD